MQHADLSTHVLTHDGREPVMETRKDASGSDFVRIGIKIRPAMRKGARIDKHGYDASNAMATQLPQW